MMYGCRATALNIIWASPYTCNDCTPLQQQCALNLMTWLSSLYVCACRDPKARPSAKDALQDVWLQGNSTERNQGKPLDATVVQRIQVNLPLLFA